VLRALDEVEHSPFRDTWDVILVGALGCVHPQGRHGLNRINAIVSGGGRRPSQVSEHVHVPRRPYGCHAYLLHRRGARKLLQRAPLAAYHVDGVAWGLRDLDILCVDPLLAFQGLTAPSTLGAVESGIEGRLPRIILDDYTGVTLPWTFNEPVIKTGPMTWTIGRCLSAIIAGYALSLGLRSRRLMYAHSALTFVCCSLVRILVQPAVRRRNISRLISLDA